MGQNPNIFRSDKKSFCSKKKCYFVLFKIYSRSRFANRQIITKMLNSFLAKNIGENAIFLKSRVKCIVQENCTKKRRRKFSQTSPSIIYCSLRSPQYSETIPLNLSFCQYFFCFHRSLRPFAIKKLQKTQFWNKFSFSKPL